MQKLYGKYWDHLWVSLESTEKTGIFPFSVGFLACLSLIVCASAGWLDLIDPSYANDLQFYVAPAPLWLIHLYLFLSWVFARNTKD